MYANLPESREADPIESRSPVDGEVIGSVRALTHEETLERVQSARRAQRLWSATPPAERRRILLRAARIIERSADELADLIHRENGKPRVEALVTEIVPATYGVQHAARTAERQLRDRWISMPLWRLMGKRSYLTYVPLGVIGIISPWNYPFGIPVPQIASALAAGNAVVLKPSSATVLIGEAIRGVFEEAGLPEHVFELVQGRGAIGEALIEGGVDHLIFTGSVEVGRHVNRLAAERFIPTTMELGGKDPMIVLADADLDTASSGALWGAFSNAGQTCASVERVYVHEDVYEDFVARVVDKTRRLRVGPDGLGSADVGTMTQLSQLRLVEEHVEDALALGAQVLTGGRRVQGTDGHYYEPTVLVDVNDEMRLMREETFGPLLPILPFSDVEEAIGLANDSEFGLTASVWTRDRKLARWIARRLETGTVTLDDATFAHGVAEAPWGGVKNSGVGRTHGEIGLMAMVRPVHVSVDSMPRTKNLWWYPYDDQLSGFLKSFMRVFNGESLTQRARGMAGVVHAFLTRKVH